MKLINGATAAYVIDYGSAFGYKHKSLIRNK